MAQACRLLGLLGVILVLWTEQCLASPCTSDDITGILPLYKKCTTESGLNLANTSEATKICFFPACRSYIRAHDLVNCTSQGIPTSVIARNCDNYTPRLVDTLPSSPSASPTTTPGHPLVPCGADALQPLALIKLKCEQVSNITSVTNVTTAAILKTYCSFPICVASLKQYAALTCAINGAPATSFTTLCDDPAPPLQTTTASTTTTSPQSDNECSPSSLSADLVAVQTACLRVANMASPPTTKVAMDALCQYPECTWTFALYGTLKCTLNDQPASVVAQTCAGTSPRPPPVPSAAPTRIMTCRTAATLLAIFLSVPGI
ncbi:hypothetical protein DYB36_005895 [Aphanomyces astaci]|uniref:Uncharacterized protein n=1 Tax=Aphanomyces astaci TaxID=112090 RepID=A0A397AWN1_APHAT|nr:hypothetical protein DYB36_005895 [Aphanomyces astaci]